MANIPEATRQKLHSLANRYALILRQRVVSALQRYNATGSLIDSIEVTVVSGVGDYGPQIKMTYEDHGDFLTKKKMLFVKLPPIEDMKAWMEARNINTSRIPGYTDGSIPNISEDKKRERIAWAISIDKRMNDTWKRKDWKRKPISTLLKELNVEIITAYRQDVEKELASYISNTNQIK